MNKNLILLNVFLVLGVLLCACGAAGQIPTRSQTGNTHEISFSLQATEAPPIPLPTIVIVNPTPGSGGSVGQINPTTLLIYVLVGAVIVIALIAVLRR